MTGTGDTVELLRRWRGGDPAALEALIAQDLPWVRAEVERRMGHELRGRADADDVVQQALIGVLQHGPRFEAIEREHYRALLLRIVENTIRKMIRDGRRQKRWAGREEPLPSRSCVMLSASGTQPASAADRNERRAWLQLGLELLPAADRELVLARQWQGKSFADLGAEFGLGEDAARKRFERAVGRLAQIVKRLRTGQLAAMLRA